MHTHKQTHKHTHTHTQTHAHAHTHTHTHTQAHAHAHTHTYTHSLFKCPGFAVREGRLSFIWSRMRCLDDSSTQRVRVCVMFMCVLV